MTILALIVVAALAWLPPAWSQTQPIEAGNAGHGGFPAGFCFNGSKSHICPFKFFCVNPGGTDGCSATISEAIAESKGHNVIIAVAPGTYVDNVAINASGPIPVGITGKRPMKLTIGASSTAAATIIDGNGAGPVFSIGPGTKVTLEDLTITGGSGGAVQGGTGGGGILANGGKLTVTNCIVSNNQAAFRRGDLRE